MSIKKTISFIICIIFIISSIFYVFSATKSQEQIADEIIEVARGEVGYYGEGSNKFNEWYYGVQSSVDWCAVFVSWCAERVGVLDTAIPKRATCSVMLDWFKARGEYQKIDSGYVPQKGDLVFFDTDGTGISHHVEFVSESGYFTDENGNKCIYCIGGNASDENYNGKDHVIERLRPVNHEKAVVMGFVHPTYEQPEENLQSFFEKLRAFFEQIIEFFRNLFS